VPGKHLSLKWYTNVDGYLANEGVAEHLQRIVTVTAAKA